MRTADRAAGVLLAATLAVASADGRAGDPGRSPRDVIAQATGMPPEIVYRAIAHRDLGAATKLVSYAQGRGMGPLEASYQAEMAALDARCRRTPGSRRHCLYPKRVLKRELAELQGRFALPLTPQNVWTKLVAATIIYYQQAVDEALQPGYRAALGACRPGVDCHASLSAWVGAVGAVSLLARLADARDRGLAGYSALAREAAAVFPAPKKPTAQP